MYLGKIHICVGERGQGCKKAEHVKMAVDNIQYDVEDKNTGYIISTNKL